MMAWLSSAVRDAAVKALESISGRVHPRMIDLYGRAVQQDARTRNPLIVIPGVMGTRLKDRASGRPLWGGDYKSGFADPGDEEQMRGVTVPMELGTPLESLVGSADPDGTIDALRVNVAGLPVQVSAYASLLRVLGAGGYWAADRRDERAWNFLNYGPESLTTSFQFDYDWRLTVPENARRLGRLVEQVIAFASSETGCSRPMKVDVVAHSLGGLVLRWYLRYGGQGSSGQQGERPELTWEGASKVEHAIMIATPNAGSVRVMEKLLRGLPASPAMPAYDPAYLGTMPGLYQLMPRVRHGQALHGGEVLDDLYTSERWAQMGWGLASPRADGVLRQLLPGRGQADRRRTALEHLDKCLLEAERVHAALDVAAEPPAGVVKHLFAGDGAATHQAAELTDKRPYYRVVAKGNGDRTVLRSSALMDERASIDPNYPRLLTPIRWDSVMFLPTDHLGLTSHPIFVNNVLYVLLEKPRPDCDFRLPPVVIPPRRGV
ncbi:MAG: hypothetical protein C0468_04145, partial [Planctomyces sp.]|nr:hypothetical protein [Planctomyces sp.]